VLEAPGQANSQGSFAEACAVENGASLMDAYCERPALVALAGDVLMGNPGFLFFVNR
jgi:hypothetical protein